MKQDYVTYTFWWLLLICLTSNLLTAQGQTTQPPTIQWQRVINDGDLTPTSTVRAVKAKNGGYGILSGKRLALLSVTGDVIWNKAVPGSYADSSTNRLPIRETIALAAAQDGGFVVLGIDTNNRYYATKLDSTGNGSWTKTLERSLNSGKATVHALTIAADGSILVVGSFSDALAYLTLTKLSAEGVIAGQWRIRFSGSPPLLTPQIHQIIPVPTGEYILAGSAVDSASTTSKGLAIQLDAQYNLTWQHQYSGLRTIQTIVPNSKAEGTYIAIGLGEANTGKAILAAPNQSNDGTQLGSFPTLGAVVTSIHDETGTLTALDAATTNNGDFRLTNVLLPSTFRWAKSFGGSGIDKPTDLLATDDGGYLAVGTTTSTNGDVVGKSTNSLATWVVKLGKSAPITTLRILTPTYTCQTGLIRFQTSGGDGSPITYTVPGVTRANPTDTFGTVEPGLRADPKVILIQATQSGQTVSYAFNFDVYCRTDTTKAPTDSLRLIAPTYNCETGAITFHTSGGNTSPIEYAAAGVTDWTTKPNQFVDSELRTAYDAKPLMLMARQNGSVVTYRFDVKAACGRARIGVVEPTANLTVTLLGNPVREHASVQIVGAEGQSVQFHLFNAQGKLIEQRTVPQAGASEQQTFDVQRQQAGTMLLRTTVNDQSQMIKVIKQ